MTKIKCIGIIAEDISDYEAYKEIIKRISNKERILFKKAIGNGCGKLKRKALDYAIDLKKRKCDLLILAHDLDRNNLKTLKKELNDKLKLSPFNNYFICIPIEEIEAWFLSDPEGIKKAFNLNRPPKIKGNPEHILSPKEKLAELIYSCSNNLKIYLNTQHNAKLAKLISISSMRQKCESFARFHDFIQGFKY